ncbi:MAG TPA: hypothetical protein VF788_20565 [Pseudonocardiaceae bacterium]
MLSVLSPTDADALTWPDTAELARLLPKLTAAGSETTNTRLVDGPPDADAARLRLFDAVARFLERVTRHGPTLVELDDLQALS